MRWNLWCIGIGLVLLVHSVSSEAQQRRNKRSFLSISAVRTQYADLKSSASTAAQTLLPTWDAELALRVRSYFNLAMLVGQSTDGTQKNYGVGLRVDLPGFFFMGGDLNREARIARKKFPVNTSVFAYLLQQQITNEADPTTNTPASTDKYAGSSLGFAMDIFLFNPFSYATAQASIFNMQGNAFLAYSFGAGIQF